MKKFFDDIYQVSFRTIQALSPQKSDQACFSARKPSHNHQEEISVLRDLVCQLNVRLESLEQTIKVHNKSQKSVDL